MELLPKGTWLKLLLYGDPGVGKTRLAGSSHLLDEMHPVLFGSCEGGTITLRKDATYDDLEIVDLTSRSQDAEEVMDNIEQFYDKAADGDYRTVVLDTLSEAQKCGLYFCSRQHSTWQKIYKEPKKITLPQYAANMVQTSVLIRAFRDLDCHVIMTAHVKRATYDVDGHNYVVPSLTGQQWKDAMAYFDVVFFMYTKAAVSIRDPEKGVRYRAMTKPFENIKAKDRLFDLPVSIDLTDRYLKEALHAKD